VRGGKHSRRKPGLKWFSIACSKLTYVHAGEAVPRAFEYEVSNYFAFVRAVWTARGVGALDTVEMGAKWDVAGSQIDVVAAGALDVGEE
jgi:hypothetical protein